LRDRGFDTTRTSNSLPVAWFGGGPNSAVIGPANAQHTLFSRNHRKLVGARRKKRGASCSGIGAPGLKKKRKKSALDSGPALTRFCRWHWRHPWASTCPVDVNFSQHIEPATTRGTKPKPAALVCRSRLGNVDTVPDPTPELASAIIYGPEPRARVDRLTLDEIKMQTPSTSTPNAL